MEEVADGMERKGNGTAKWINEQNRERRERLGRGGEEAKTSSEDETNGCWSALRCRDGYEDIEE